MMDLKNKKVGVVGLSKRTGVSTVKFLLEKGAQVVATDHKNKEELSEELDLLKGLDINYELNGHGEKSLNTEILVVSPGVPLDLDFFKKARKRNIEIISEIELAYRFTEAKIIAVTGTNGKTTTTRLLGEIMSAYYGDKVVVAGNIGTPLISVATGLSKDNWIVVEVSSFQLEAIKNFKADISIFLNFSEDHLDRHKTVKNYLNAKTKIFINQENNDRAVINYDDEDIRNVVSNYKMKKHYISGNTKVDNGAFISNNKIYFYNNKEKINLISSKELNLKGKHNLMNTAFASYSAYLAGVDIETIRKSIKKFKADKHRIEIIYKNNFGNLVVDDSKATNPDAAIKALDTFDNEIILIAGGQDRNANFEKLSKKIKEKVKTLILLGETSDKIHKEVLKRGFKNIYKVENMREAVEKAYDEYEKGDCLLLSPACPSWDMYESYKKRGEIFNKEVKRIMDISK